MTAKPMIDSVAAAAAAATAVRACASRRASAPAGSQVHV